MKALEAIKARKSLVSSSDFSFFLGVLFLGGGGVAGRIDYDSSARTFFYGRAEFGCCTFASLYHLSCPR